jgi:CBS domain-containing protein
MKAAEVMVRNVITIGPDATIGEVADLLVTHRISAMPVVDGNGKIVGVVSEGDLLRRAEAGTDLKRSHWLEWMMPGQTLAAEFVKSHSRRVSDVMTRKVIAVTPDTPLNELATTLEKNGIKRVPVVENGKLVGIVSRSNLVQALASLYKRATPATIDDAKLRSNVVAQLESQSWTHPSLLNVIVHDGNVELWGIVDSAAEKSAVRVAAEVTPGVKSVNDNLQVRPPESYA